MTTSILPNLNNTTVATDAPLSIEQWRQKAASNTLKKIKEQGHKILSNYSTKGLIDKAHVELLVNQALIEVMPLESRAKQWVLVCCLLMKFFPNNTAPFLASIFFCFFSGYDLNRIQNLLFELKKELNGMKQINLVWQKKKHGANLFPIISKYQVLLETKLLFLNLKPFFGREIHEMTDLINEKIESINRNEDFTQIQSAPKGNNAHQTLRDHLINLKETVIQRIQTLYPNHSQSAKPREVYNIIYEILYPIGHLRGLFIILSIGSYSLTQLIPLFSIRLFVQFFSVCSAWMAFELHLSYEATRKELTNPLIRKWSTPVKLDQLINRMKRAASRVLSQTIILNFFFKNQIQTFPKLIEKAVKENPMKN